MDRYMAGQYKKKQKGDKADAKTGTKRVEVIYLPFYLLAYAYMSGQGFVKKKTKKKNCNLGL